MAMILTPAERATVIAQLREEAVAACRAIGCTCDPEPEMTLTAQVFGPHALPAWMSDHGPDCEAARWPRKGAKVS